VRPKDADRAEQRWVAVSIHGVGSLGDARSSCVKLVAFRTLAFFQDGARDDVEESLRAWDERRLVAEPRERGDEGEEVDAVHVFTIVDETNNTVPVCMGRHTASRSGSGTTDLSAIW